jgi:hypothetical protein
MDESKTATPCTMLYIVDDAITVKEATMRIPMNPRLAHGPFAALPVFRERRVFSSKEAIETERRNAVEDTNISAIIHWQHLSRSSNNVFRSPLSKDCPNSCSQQSYRFHLAFLDLPYELWIGMVLFARPNTSSSISVIAVSEERHKDIQWSSPANNFKDSGPRFTTSTAIIFITYDVNMFMENALALKKALNRVGINRVEIMGQLNHTRYLEFQQELHCFTGREALCDRLVQLSIGPHRNAFLSLNFIAFHTENDWDEFVPKNNDPLDKIGNIHPYIPVLINAQAILVYSRQNVNFLERFLPATDMKKVFLTPMYSQPLYFDVRFDGEDTHDDESHGKQIIAHFPGELDFDVVVNRIDFSLLMSPSPNRNLFLNFLYPLHRSEGWKVYVNQHECLHCFDQWMKEALAVQSRLSFNVHQFPSSALETHRINLLLSLGVPIISEETEGLADWPLFYPQQRDSFTEVCPVLNNSLIPIQFFQRGDWNGLFSKAKDIIENPSVKESMSRSAKLLHQTIHDEISELSRMVTFLFDTTK